MKTLAEEFQELCDAASFTMVDMGIWCECHKSAIREWMKHDVTPHPIKLKHLYERFDLLRKLLLDPRALLPIPAHITQYDRNEYVEKARDYAVRRFPKLCAPQTRDKVLDKHPE